MISRLAGKALGAVLGADLRTPLACAASIAFIVTAGWGSLQWWNCQHALSERDTALQSVESLKSGIEVANAVAAAHKTSQEAKQTVVTHEEDSDIRSKLAAALERLHDSSASKGHSVPSPVPEDAKPSPSSSGTGQEAVVDDEETCTAAVIKAEGWQGWYAKEVAASDPASHHASDEDHLAP